MEKFIITPNEFLRESIQAYYRYDYIGYEKVGNPDFLNDLKNQFNTSKISVLQNAVNELEKVLQEDLPVIRNLHDINLTVCVVPRAKSEDFYTDNQKLFRKVVSNVVDKLYGFENGTKYIIRHTDTRTTHLNRSGYGGVGEMPYVGITKDTCNISNEVKGKDILLIDDIYTKTINVDEDAIQALLDYGANSVIFYAVAKTIRDGNKQIIYPFEIIDDDDQPIL